MRSGRTVNGSGEPRSRTAMSPDTTFEVPTKPATNEDAGCSIDLRGSADLLDAAEVEHCDAVTHREGFVLIVGHVDERDAHLDLDPLELDLHVLTELEVERTEGLVEQQHAGPVHECARERDSLPLPTRQLRDPAIAVAVEMHEAECLFGAGSAVALGHPPHLQPELDVLADGHVGEQRVVLEHGVDVSVVRRDARDILAVQEHSTRGRLLEPRDHPQARRLARA